MSRTSEGDSDAEEYNWEARMNETFKKDDLLRACKSILEDAKLKAGN